MVVQLPKLFDLSADEKDAFLFRLLDLLQQLQRTVKSLQDRVVSLEAKKSLRSGIRKLSCREEGGDIFCRIRGYIPTQRKNGLSILTSLESVLQNAPILPARIAAAE